MLALVMVWAYFNFSQFLIIWSGNLPEETGWYMTRMKGGWGAIGVILIFSISRFRFSFCFSAISSEMPNVWRWLAIFILILRLVDMFYLIGPSPRITRTAIDRTFHVSWLDFVAPIAVGGIWLWWFFRRASKTAAGSGQGPVSGKCDRARKRALTILEFEFEFELIRT